MVETLNKAFKLDLASRQNWDAYLEARGTAAELRKVASSTAIVIEYTLTGDQLTLKTSIPGTDRESTNSYKLGEETDVTTRDGFKVKTTWARDGKKLIETQRGESKTFVIVHDFSTPNEVNVTFTVDNVVAKHTYKAI